MNKLLSEFLSIKAPQALPENIMVTGIASDCRNIQSGNLFIAVASAERYIPQAVSNGAVAIVVDSSSIVEASVPVIKIKHLDQQLASIAQKFYDYDPNQMVEIAITGTNGKTSCTHMIAQLLVEFNHPCGAIGTLGHGIFPCLCDPNLTTPDLLTVYSLLNDFRQAQVKYVCLEASSHGLHQNRLAGIGIDYGIFTNLTHDHLDYHKNFKAYAASKRKLFERPLKAAIINADDAFGRQLIAEYASEYPIIAYTQFQQVLAEKVSLISAEQVRYTTRGIIAQLRTPWGEAELKLPLIGRFNLSNALACLGCLIDLGFDFAQIVDSMQQLQTVIGRMQLLHYGQYDVVIDFAHTPDSLEQALTALQQHCSGRIICVFGCGGDRDRDKRPIMGGIAEKYADMVVLTSDNPRFEDSDSIIKEILVGIHNQHKVNVQPDRAKAISEALAAAKVNDLVLIAGKGHEQYQQVKSERRHFSDHEQVEKYFAQMGEQ